MWTISNNYLPTQWEISAESVHESRLSFPFILLHEAFRCVFSLSWRQETNHDFLGAPKQKKIAFERSIAEKIKDIVGPQMLCGFGTSGLCHDIHCLQGWKSHHLVDSFVVFPNGKNGSVHKAFTNYIKALLARNEIQEGYHELCHLLVNIFLW